MIQVSNYLNHTIQIELFMFGEEIIDKRFQNLVACMPTCKLSHNRTYFHFCQTNKYQQLTSVWNINKNILKNFFSFFSFQVSNTYYIFSFQQVYNTIFSNNTCRLKSLWFSSLNMEKYTILCFKIVCIQEVFFTTNAFHFKIQQYKMLVWHTLAFLPPRCTYTSHVSVGESVIVLLPVSL